MSEQLSLAGFESATRPTDRLFFALLPDSETATAIAVLTQQLRAELGLKAAPLRREHLHVTLFFLGDFIGLPRGIVANAERAAATLAWSAFDVLFDRVLSFSGKQHRRPLVLCGQENEDVRGLIEFQHELAITMNRAGIASAAHQNFVPHLTLLYDDQHVTRQTVASVRWTASEFVLVRSVLGQSRHETLGRWPLISRCDVKTK